MGKKALRRGFTTGTCAAAGAKAAAQALFARLRGGKEYRPPASVEVSLPRGGAILIPISSVTVEGGRAAASVIKDAGDDPDVTNGAEFIAEVEFIGYNRAATGVSVRGGHGVGVVTKPGLKVPVGRPAINPVPMRMIRRAVREAARDAGVKASVRVTVTVPKGESLAKKTMNPRLGIAGGISILGTTGIVEPMSLEAYRHSISCGTDVALAAGLGEVVFSTGRSSEKAVESELGLPQEAFILTGDHMGYALRDASGRRGLERVTVAGQFGKFTKLAAGSFETHCTESSVEFAFLAGLCREMNCPERVVEKVLNSNTAREVFFILKKDGREDILKAVCRLVKNNSSRITGKRIKVRAILAGYEDDIVCVC